MNLIVNRTATTGHWMRDAPHLPLECRSFLKLYKTILRKKKNIEPRVVLWKPRHSTLTTTNTNEEKLYFCLIKLNQHDWILHVYKELKDKKYLIYQPLILKSSHLLLRIHHKLHDAELPVLRAKLTRNWCSKPATWLKLIVLSVPEPLLVSQQTRKFRYISSNQVLLQQKKIRYLFKSIVPVQTIHLKTSGTHWFQAYTSKFKFIVFGWKEFMNVNLKELIRKTIL